MLFSSQASVVVGCHSDLDLKASIFSCLLTLIVDTSLGLFMSSFDSLFLFYLCLLFLSPYSLSSTVLK